MTAPAIPLYFYEADGQLLLDLVADMVERITVYNDQLPLLPEGVTRFHSRAPPGISVRDYLRRVVRYANVEKCCLLMILVFIDRICARGGTSFVVSSLTVHRVMIATVVVASKSLCDNYYTNVHYAKVGGISLNELNTLELELLFLLDWKLTSNAETLQRYYSNLVRNSLQQRQQLQQQQQQQLFVPPSPPNGTVAPPFAPQMATPNFSTPPYQQASAASSRPQAVAASALRLNQPGSMAT